MSEEKRIGFMALIQEVKIKSLRTGDKSMRITLEIEPVRDGFVGKVDELHAANKRVAVAFAEAEESD